MSGREVCEPSIDSSSSVVSHSHTDKEGGGKEIRRGCKMSAGFARVPRGGLSQSHRNLIVAVVFLIMVRIGEGRDSKLVIKDDTRAAYLVEPFCFSAGGKISVEVGRFLPRRSYATDAHRPLRF